MSLIRGIYQKIKDLFPTTLKLVGTDLKGNQYFEEPRDSFPRRTIKLNDGRNHYHDVLDEKIPIEWMAWLRHTRTNPPTLQELEFNEAMKKATIEKARSIEIEFQKRKLELNKLNDRKTSEKALPKPKPQDAFAKKDFEPESWSPTSIKK